MYIVKRYVFQFGDGGLAIVNIAKHDRLGRTGGLTCGLDFTVADRTIFLFRVYLRDIDALHTVGAFFHDATAPHRDVGVSHRLQARRVKIGILEKVEPAHFVRAIVGAIAGADAAVVNHVVQHLMAMIGRTHRADQFAGGVLAVHTRHGLMISLRIFRASFIIAIDAQPMHLPRAGHFGFAYHRDVVFCLAGNDTGVAADAGAHVDGHAPGVTLVLEAWVKRAFWFWVMLFLHEVRIFPIFL